MYVTDLKVVAQSGYKYRETSTITLKGLWLSEVGFQIGDYISAKCEDGRLIIEPDTERATIIEAEKTFMDKELKNMHKRFESERERLHLQSVAEQRTGYGA